MCFPLGWHSIIAVAAKFAGVKNVCTHAGNPAHNINKNIFWKFNLLIQIGRPFTNKIICCSNYIQKSIIESFSLSNNEIITIYNSYDEDKFIFRNEYKLKVKKNSSKEIVIGMVGRLEQHKDQESLIKAVKILKDKRIKIKLLLIGDGTLRFELKQLTRELNLLDQVIFLGSRNDIETILEKLDIFVFSTSEDEGFGMRLPKQWLKGFQLLHQMWKLVRKFF